MWQSQPLANLRASAARTGKTLPYVYIYHFNLLWFLPAAGCENTYWTVLQILFKRFRFENHNQSAIQNKQIPWLQPASELHDRLCGLVVRVPGYRSRGPGFDSRRSQIFWEVVGLERGPLSLVSTIEELFGRNSGGSGLEIREYGLGDPLHWPSDTLYPLK
jgi:hypothetical protein